LTGPAPSGMTTKRARYARPAGDWEGAQIDH
jgi:hypothetical protein